MPAVNRGEVWMVDFGLLTSNPSIDELDLVTVLLHTTALRGNRWELPIRKSFLREGAFHLQQVQTVSTVKLERRLGVLTDSEMSLVLDRLAYRLGLSAQGPP